MPGAIPLGDGGVTARGEVRGARRDVVRRVAGRDAARRVFTAFFFVGVFFVGMLRCA
jgi:hypothetical protein